MAHGIAINFWDNNQRWIVNKNKIFRFLLPKIVFKFQRRNLVFIYKYYAFQNITGEFLAYKLT